MPAASIASSALPLYAPSFGSVQNLAQLGLVLRNSRKGRELSIDHIAQELHLKSKHIEALEKGDWSQLPGEIYGRGYLRQYADYLGLPSEKAMEALQRISGQVETDLHYMEIAESEESWSRGALWLSAIASLLLLVGWNLYQDRTVPKMEIAVLPVPHMLEGSEAKLPSARLEYTIEATCLNIPQRQIETCFAKPLPYPSLLLKNSAIYPIWTQ